MARKSTAFVKICAIKPALQLAQAVPLRPIARCAALETAMLRAIVLGLLATCAAGCDKPDCDVWDCGTCGAPCCIRGLVFRSALHISNSNY